MSLTINGVEIEDDSCKIQSNKFIISGGVAPADKYFFMKTAIKTIPEYKSQFSGL